MRARMPQADLWPVSSHHRRGLALTTRRTHTSDVCFTTGMPQNNLIDPVSPPSRHSAQHWRKAPANLQQRNQLFVCDALDVI